MKILYLLSTTIVFVVGIVSAFLPTSTTTNSKSHLLLHRLHMVVSEELTKPNPTPLLRNDDKICKDIKTIVITGASQGLGQAMAYELVSLFLHTIYTHMEKTDNN